MQRPCRTRLFDAAWCTVYMSSMEFLFIDCRNRYALVFIYVEGRQRTLQYMILSSMPLCYPSYNMARAIQKLPVIMTTCKTDLVILDARVVTSTILIQIHHQFSNRLARMDCLLDLTPRLPSCQSGNHNCNAAPNRPGLHRQRPQSKMHKYAASGWRVATPCNGHPS